jgi:hypothetical protein
VSDEFGTKLELVWKETLNILFEEVTRAQINAVPILWLAQVKVVDRVKVHIFLMPAKHSFPCAYVNVGRCHSIYFCVGKALATPLYYVIETYFKTVLISARFHGTPASNILPKVSAP